MGAALGAHDGDGFIWVPMCHQDRGRTQQQRRFEGVDRSANMADGGRHQKAVAPFDQPMAADLADQRVDAVMAVENALWPSGGAAGIHDHANIVGIDGWERRVGDFCQQVGKGDVRACLAAQDDDGGRAVQRRGDAREHGGIVMPAKAGGDEDHRTVQVGEDEAQIMVA